ncbi:MAG: DEAD/DEAH box helicase [Acidimicrobiales bacterium]
MISATARRTRTLRGDDLLADDISTVLEQRPGLTTAEIAATLTTERAHARAIALALFNGRDRFRCDRGLPQRWWLLAASGPGHDEPARPLARGRTAVFDRSRLYAWQRDALDAWAAARHRGVVEAVTGSGKTMLGVAAAAGELARRGQVLVIVPTLELMYQWGHQMAPTLASGYSIGLRSGSGTGSFATDDIVIGVVNSLRGNELRITRRGGLLVADECHRYASAMNRLALDQRFERRLGLSATYAREDDRHVDWLDPYFGGTCFQMGYRRAVDDGVTARFTVALIGVALPAPERAVYEDLTKQIGRSHARLMNRYQLPTDSFGRFIRALNLLAAGAGSDTSGASEARRYLALLLERRRLLGGTSAKPRTLTRLAPAIASADRSIVFTSSIASAEIASSVLAGQGLRAGALHSGLKRTDRRAVLRRFADGNLHVLTAPRVLDEGVDVPEADLAVIVGASRSRRQMIQRMGRVLRTKPDRRRARFAVLYVEATVEDPTQGAHETFLEEVTGVADEVRSFASCSGSLDDAIEFLHPHGRR